jgi:hypothetical protein
MESLAMIVKKRTCIVRMLTAFACVGIAFLTPKISEAASSDPNSGLGGVPGYLNFSGHALLTTTSVNFLCDVSGVGSCPAGSGAFTAGAGAAQSGSFVPYANDTGFIKNLSENGGQPLNTPFLLNNFITFNAAGSIQPPDVTFTLNGISLGVDSQVDCSNPVVIAGQTCTPQIPQLVSPANPNGLSPFNLMNTANGSILSFSVSGTVTRISTGITTPSTGVFTFVFTDDPGTTDGSFQAELRQLSINGSVTGTYSATFNAPEPMTSVLFGSGLLVLGFVLRRKRA